MLSASTQGSAKTQVRPRLHRGQQSERTQSGHNQEGRERYSRAHHGDRATATGTQESGQDQEAL